MTLRAIVLLALSVCLYAAMIWSIDVGTFFGQIASIEPPFVAAVVLTYAAAWWLRSLRLRQLLESAISTLASFRVQIAGFALNLVYPAKIGDLFMASFLKRATTLSYQHALAHVIFLRILDFISLAAAFFVSLLVFTPPVISDRLLLPLIIVAACCVLCGVGVVVLRRNVIVKLLRRLPNSRFNPTRLFRELAELHSGSRRFWTASSLSVVIWSFEAAVCMMFAWAIAADVPMLAILPALALANIMKALPGLPGGVGTYEAGFVVVLLGYGVPAETALTLALLDQLFKRLINLMVGFAVYVRIEAAGHPSARPV